MALVMYNVALMAGRTSVPSVDPSSARGPQRALAGTAWSASSHCHTQARIDQRANSRCIRLLHALHRCVHLRPTTPLSVRPDSNGDESAARSDD
jgi:hypothetical protein